MTTKTPVLLRTKRTVKNYVKNELLDILQKENDSFLFY